MNADKNLRVRELNFDECPIRRGDGRLRTARDPRSRDAQWEDTDSALDFPRRASCQNCDRGSVAPARSIAAWALSALLQRVRFPFGNGRQEFLNRLQEYFRSEGLFNEDHTPSRIVKPIPANTRDVNHGNSWELPFDSLPQFDTRQPRHFHVGYEQVYLR